MKTIKEDLSTQDVLNVLIDSGRPVREWGKAQDNTPMLSIQTGGFKQPPIFITAGAHSTESAGVHAALNLIDCLKTDHEVHILPLRDPFGFAGFQHCLSYASGKTVLISDYTEALVFLERNAETLWQKGEMKVFLLGNTGFVWYPLGMGLEGYWQISNQIAKLAREEPETLRPLWGKSLMLTNPWTGIEGASELLRCWHGYFDERGKWLHLNRMFGLKDAAVEVAAVDNLMQSVRPGLTCDLHEGNGKGFWLPLPKPKENTERVFKMAKAFFDYVTSKNYPITDYEDWLASDQTPQTSVDPDWMLPEPRQPGLFWVNTLERGEGHNLSTYADLRGVAFGTESPMIGSLDMRVDVLTKGTITAIKSWEESLPIIK
ncbi:MAG: hypothetical protein JEZ06_03535 [Anaerolineaceae bacterium]|nr:hypothetical protein [Anaerolineaceae bacterium]